MNGNDQAERLMNSSLRILFRDVLRITGRNPALAIFALKSLLRQGKAFRRRRRNARQGVTVPPYMIVSVTGACNLSCAGCYARAQHRAAGEEMSDEELRGLFIQARDLGVSVILIAGGEPFTRTSLLSLTRATPEIVFPVFTNGMLIDAAAVDEMNRRKNIVPVFSFEGNEDETDARRGKGVYHNLRDITGRLREKNIFWGVSLTVTRNNFATVTDRAYLEEFVRLGSRIFFFVEYIPVREGTEGLVPTQEQRAALNALSGSLRRKLPAIFFAFPGEEEDFGGCMSSGRGFVHVSPRGDLEPCPFAPYSDTNIRKTPLRDALRSKLLSAVRDNRHRLQETGGGCALWHNREWVKSLENGAAAEGERGRK